MRSGDLSLTVTPAKAGIQPLQEKTDWTSAFAGVTKIYVGIL